MKPSSSKLRTRKIKAWLLRDWHQDKIRGFFVMSTPAHDDTPIFHALASAHNVKIMEARNAQTTLR